jgi:cytochrome c-type biogenesis protein CcmE
MSRKLLAASLAASAGILALVLTSKPRAVYAYGVRDFLKRDVRDQPVRVRGRLVHGSLCRAATGCSYRFALADESLDDNGSVTLPVEYDSCMAPDLLRDVSGYDLSVSIEGERCQNCHRFQASQIMTTCSGAYEMPSRSRPAPHVPAPPPPLCAR